MSGNAVRVKEEPGHRRPIEAQLRVVRVDQLVIVEGIRADVESSDAALKPGALRVHVDLAGSEESVKLERLGARGCGGAEEKERERFTHGADHSLQKFGPRSR